MVKIFYVTGNAIGILGKDNINIGDVTIKNQPFLMMHNISKEFA